MKYPKYVYDHENEKLMIHMEHGQYMYAEVGFNADFNPDIAEFLADANWGAEK